MRGLERAREVLEGLSVGDAVGEALSYQYHRCREIDDFSAFRPGTLRFTDDSEMAIALYDTLQMIGGVEEDVVAWAYASRFRRDPERGYGKMARRILEEIGRGADWRDISPTAFGHGSFGNGAAMRVAPLGSFFAEDLGVIPEMAARSARVTHYHPEGIAGSIAVAMATAAAFNSRGLPSEEAVRAIWDSVLSFTPESKVRTRLALARGLAAATHAEVAREYGNGAEVSAQDTVPFCIWSACENIGNYQEAILATLEVGGDCDTNCAITGSIVTAFAGLACIPEQWLRAREPLSLKS